MHASYLPLFAIPGSDAPLEFVGRQSDNELIEGRLFASGQAVGRVTGGVACFWEDDNWSEEQLAEIMTPEWMARKWQDKATNDDSTMMAFCEELAVLDGVILEIAVGPGGGNLQGILHRNRRARLIVNDTSLRLLLRWCQFIGERALAEDICFAAFDAREMVLRDESVAAVSGVAAFSNINGPGAFQEAWRVLQPDGAVYAWDMIVDAEDWRRLPVAFRAHWEQQTPGFVRGTAELLSEVGFRIEHHQIVPGRAMSAEQDGIQKQASEYGVRLHVVYEHVRARKLA